MEEIQKKPVHGKRLEHSSSCCCSAPVTDSQASSPAGQREARARGDRDQRDTLEEKGKGETGDSQARTLVHKRSVGGCAECGVCRRFVYQRAGVGQETLPDHL